MSWLGDSRRSGTELPGDLEQALPEELRQRAQAIGNELILSYQDTLTAIASANERDIAVLGFEAGEVLDSGFRVLDYNGYDFKFLGDWKAYVQANNAEAERWVREHRYGKSHGYIVTSTSEREFARLPQRKT